MTTQTDSAEHPFAKRGSSNPLAAALTALSAAVCLALSFGLVFEAFAIAAAGLFDLDKTYLYVVSGIIGVGTLWLGTWCFARGVHVERRLRNGLDVDQPDLSILGNLKSGGQAPAQG